MAWLAKPVLDLDAPGLADVNAAGRRRGRQAAGGGQGTRHAAAEELNLGTAPQWRQKIAKTERACVRSTSRSASTCRDRQEILGSLATSQCAAAGLSDTAVRLCRAVCSLRPLRDKLLPFS